MEGNPQLGYPIDNDDGKYVSGLSTILVATIQEAKDRISQIEYIFCSQLFPNFQSKSKSLQKIYSEATKAAEDAWKNKEKDLLLQLEKLQHEKQQALEESKAFRLEKAKLSKEQEENTNLHLAKLRSLEKRVGELERELLRKSKEVDEGMELQNELLQLVQTKTNAIVNKGKQLKEHEENINMHVVKLKCLEEKVDELQEELNKRNEEVIKGKELQENLLKKIELWDLKVVENELPLNDREKEKRQLTAIVERLEGNVDRLQEELRKKIEEVEEGRKLQDQLVQQIHLNSLKLLKNEQQLEEHDKEEKPLMAKLKGLEQKVDELQMDPRGRSSEMAEGKESCAKLLQQIELKDSELLSEKKRTRDAIAAYKRLKSQHNYLLKKQGYTMDSTLARVKVEEESNSLRCHQNPRTFPDLENKIPDNSAAASETNEMKNGIIFQENLEDEKGIRLIQNPSSHSPSSSISPSAPKCPTDKRSAPLAGTKRSTSYWRETRSRQCQGGPDPHDDFLDTPFENIRENLNKATKEEVHDLPGPVPKDMNFDGSDDETQDMNVGNNPQKQQTPASRPSTGSFKFVEPVRKKAERENLKGVECKQCKKFYDAVLPVGGKDIDGDKCNVRCEHHDGVSRHRYRYVPPMTPEGFWNIGFDSEL